MRTYWVLVLSFVLSAGYSQTIYEAEAAYGFDGVVASNHAGFSGTGFVDLANRVGSCLEYRISMEEIGDQTVTVYYANGVTNNRALDVEVNGTIVVQSLDFPGTGAWDIWSTQTTVLPLQSGINAIKFISTTTDGGPNIDKITVTGEPGSAFHKVEWSIYGNGTVAGLENGAMVPEGQSVTLTAVAPAGVEFGGWRGTHTASNAELTFVVEENVSVSAVFINEGTYVRTDEQIGWVTWHPNGNRSITGGAGGTEVTVTTQSELEYYISQTAPYIINIQGTININPYKKMDIKSNKTIQGVGVNATITGGGFRIRNATNVIIQYITLKDAFVDWEGKTTDNDAIEINNSTYVWINHCDFSYFDDGLIDVKTGSDFVTISWCRFHNHNKVILIGSGDNIAGDVGKLNVTIHHNWFDGNGGNGIGQRLPLGRYGKIHVFNNFYDGVLIRGAEANFAANMVVDNNYFLNSAMPHALVGGLGNNVMNASGNIYVNSGSRRDNSGQAFKPSVFYNYNYNNAADVPALVMLGAGISHISEIGQNAPTNSYEISSEKPAFLGQNFPNPASGGTTIPYAVTAPATLKIEVFDILGYKLMEPFAGNQPPGNYQVTLNTGDLKPGIYIYTLTTNGYSESRYMVVSR